MAALGRELVFGGPAERLDDLAPAERAALLHATELMERVAQGR